MPLKYGILAVLAVLGVGPVQSALAAPLASTRLVECDTGSCLLVKGYRANSASAVSINGHPIAAAGEHIWRARVPMETLRGWSDAYARTITVAVADATSQVDLPVGLLGHTTNLALITISLK